MKILAVDNDIDALRQIESSLKRVYETCEVVSFDNPLQVLKYCVNYAGEIVRIYAALLMRPIDGFELAESVKKCSPGIGIEYITQTENAELAGLMENRGCWQYFVKPVTPEALMERARETQEICLAGYDEEVDEGKFVDCIYHWCERHQKQP